MASARKPQICWDSGVFIALISGEAGRVQSCRLVAEAAERGELEIVASFLAIAEVAKARNASDVSSVANLETIRAFFENEFLRMVVVDRLVAERAQELVRQYPVKGADAVHIATALLARVEAFHSWDEKLWKLSGQIAGLKIGPPDWTSQLHLAPSSS